MTKEDRKKITKDIKLLDKSIEKWRKIEDGTGVDLGPDNCALCQEYFHAYCGGCPVDCDGHYQCEGSPYSGWSNACESCFDVEDDYKAITPKLVRLAKAEKDYLADLKSRLKKKLKENQ